MQLIKEQLLNEIKSSPDSIGIANEALYASDCKPMVAWFCISILSVILN